MEDLSLDYAFLPWAITILVLMTAMSFFLLQNKNLKMHPYKLYAFEGLACVFFFWNWYSWYFIIDIVELFMFFQPFFFNNRPLYESKFKLAVFLKIQNQFFEQSLFYTLYPLLNCLLFIDLWWITKNPFYPQRKRQVAYLAVILLDFFVSFIGFVITIFSDSVQVYRTIRAYNSIFNTILGTISLFLLICVYYLMRRQGSSSKSGSGLESRVICRYILSYFCMIPIMIININYWYLQLFLDD